MSIVKMNSSCGWLVLWFVQLQYCGCSGLERKVMDEIGEWRALAHDLMQTGHDIFATADVQVTEKGYGDEKYLALTLLARTMSNFRGALLLLDNRRVIEGRIITRCCLENSYWVAGLVKDGEKFSCEMLHDTMSHKKKAGQRIVASGAPLGDEVEARLRGWLRTNSKRFHNPKQLMPKAVADKTVIGRSYMFYEQLSSDSCHPSLDALRRHVVPHTPEEIGGVDVEPIPSDRELAETLEYLCMAVMGVCVGVNQLIGCTSGGAALNKLADRYSDVSNRANASRGMKPTVA